MGLLSKTINAGTLLILMSDMREDSDWVIELNNFKHELIDKLYIIKTNKRTRFRVKRSGYSWEITHRSSIYIPFLTLILFCRFVLSRNLVIQCHGFHAGFIGAILGKLLQSPSIIDRHHGVSHYNLNISKGILCDRISSKLASWVVVHSPIMRKAILAKEPWIDEKCKVIPLGINLEKFTNTNQNSSKEFRKILGASSETFLIGTNARGELTKGLHTVLTAFQHLNSLFPNSMLLMINIDSSDVEYNKLRKLAEGFPVQMIKTVPDISVFYKSIDLFCHVPISPEAEPAGLVYIEAIASGCKSIFTRSGVVADVGTLPSFIKFVDFENVEVLSELMLESLNSQPLPNPLIISDFLQVYTLNNFRNVYTSLTVSFLK